jgi:hypothetical protein
MRGEVIVLQSNFNFNPTDAPSKAQRNLFPELYLSGGQGSPLAHAV